MKMKDITIGILAGMGPRSTAPFVDMLVTECRRQYGAKYDEEFPRMMIYSLPVPFRADEPPDEGALRGVVCEGLRRLEATGVEFIAMPCNTVHVFHEELSKCVRVPLLNMIDETLGAVPPAARRVALLATRMTSEAGLYQSGVARAGLCLVSPEGWQRRVDELIVTVKTSPDRAAAQGLWDGLVADAAEAGADTVLLGCTDLNAVDARVPAGVTLLDATACLARAVVRRYVERAAG
ncbi:MAG TPA: amino acid racemase [Pyrinomonadaceae bacterium]